MKTLSKIVLGVCSALLLLSPAYAKKCDVSITEMNWKSSQVVTEVAKFIMENGYGCKVTKVPSATVPAATSLAENNKPDIATEIWYNSAPVYGELVEAGKVKNAANVLSDGGVEGWWIPRYLAEKHPELTTIEGVMANTKLVGNRFHNCPDGWGCRIANDNYVKAYDMVGNIEIFNHGSGETLAASLASAYNKKEPWFGYYWAPTALLGKYDMVKVNVGAVDMDAHACAQKKDCPNPRKSDFPAAPVVTGVTSSFANANPAVFVLMTNVSFTNKQMGEVLAWQEANNASSEEAAVYFLSNYKNVWKNWLNDDAAKRLNKIL